MSTQGVSLFSTLYSYFYPNLIHEPKQNLLAHHARLNKASKIAQGSFFGFAGLSIWTVYRASQKEKKEVTWLDSAVGMLTVTSSVISAKMAQGIFEQIEKVELLIDAESLPFDVLFSNGLLERFSLADQRVKFEELIAIIQGKSPDTKKKCFLQMSRDFNLLKLVESGVAKIEHCLYENYGIDLKDISHEELPYLFPLCDDSSQLPQLKEACEKQQNLYSLLKKISDRYPDRISGSLSQLQAAYSSENCAAHQRGWMKDIQQPKWD